MKPANRRRKWDLGRLPARLLCAFFALLGTIPLAAGVMVRSPPVLAWASRETSELVARELGINARFAVETRLWPLQVRLRGLVVDASDGGSPVVEAERVAITPRFFSLLSGRLDVGEIEIDAPRGRIVVRDGRIKNLAFKAREKPKTKRPTTRDPFSSVSVSDARVRVDFEGVGLDTGSVDLDLTVEPGGEYEIGVRVSGSTLERTRDLGAAAGRPSVDEDVLCRMTLRARVDAAGVLVHRLSLVGAVDVDPDRGTRPVCQPREDENDPRRVAVRLSQFRVTPRTGKLPLVSGHAVLRAPASLVNRFVRTEALKGWVGLSAEIHATAERSLPDMQGKLRGAGLEFERYRLARDLNAEFAISADEIRLRRADVGIADGTASFEDVLVRPLAPGVALKARRMVWTGAKFPGLMRDLGVTPNTVVGWDFGTTTVTDFGGTIQPLALDGKLHASTHDFEVFDRAFHDPARQRMIGVRAAEVRGRIGVRPRAFEFYDTTATFGSSRVVANLVSIGFDNQVKLEIGRSPINLADISPLSAVSLAGMSEVSARMAGPAGNPLLTGDLSVRGLELGGLPVGDVLGSQVRFEPLHVDFTEVRCRKNKSDFKLPSARLDFGQTASLVADGTAESSRFELRDFLQMFRFDQDPRFADLRGTNRVKTRVHYELGGAHDRCGGGVLRVQGELGIEHAELLDESYDGGGAEFALEWADRQAGYRGISLDVPSLSLRKGSGVLLGSLNVKPGAKVSGHLVATAVPVSSLQGLGTLGRVSEARASGVAEVGGTLDNLAVDAQVDLSPWRVGSASLPASELHVKLRPIVRPVHFSGTTHCGQPIGPPFDRAEYDQDLPAGVFEIEGGLFGGQVRLAGLSVTRQRQKRVRGQVELNRLDLGALAELVSDPPWGEGKLSGRLTGKLAIEQLETSQPARARVAFEPKALSLTVGGANVELRGSAAPVRLGQGKLEVPRLSLAVTAPGGLGGVFDASGTISDVGQRNEVDATLALRPVELGKLASLMPRIERAHGSVRGGIRLHGAPAQLRYDGGFTLKGGELVVRGLPAPVSDLDLTLEVAAGELRGRGTARMGSGTLRLSGSAPLRGSRLGAARSLITARGLGFPLGDGVKATVDADLVASWEPSEDADAQRRLPRISGDVTLKSFVYSRPITLSADIASLGRRGKRTTFESYDPADDAVEFEVTLRSDRPLKINNNMVDASLVTSDLTLAGTNQRFGMRGGVRLQPGGRLRLRRSEFEIRQGTVRFDDLTRIAPQVDVTATTEYRRYAGLDTGARTGPAGTSSGSTSGSTGGAAGGRWLITLHAYGDAEKLKVDLSSEPAMAQDDIFLLLTVGVTRAELDQSQSASVGGSVALEALGTMTGADRAVQQVVPVIDEFRFGSAYSSRTGRTEPTVTIGKRLAERIRANVTSGLAESREVRSNLEWQLNRRVSVQGSYDNVNDISSSSLGNLGADVRWRLEFE
jgi:translocation and assembly module TamB